MRKPIFIGGHFKSGTTLLRAMLGRHSRIVAGLETYWFQIDLSDKEALDNKISQLAIFYDIPAKIVREIAESSTSGANLLDSFMSLVAERQSKQRWLEKTPGNILYLEQIFSHWPDAQFIHIYRDPRDIYVSMIAADKLSSMEKYARIWSRFAIAADQYSKNLNANNKHFHKLSYESLIMDSQTEIRNILRFLGETWETPVTIHTGNLEEYNKVREVTGKKSSTLLRTAKPMTESRIGIWQHSLTSDDLAKLEKYMTEFDSIEIYRRQIYNVGEQSVKS